MIPRIKEIQPLDNFILKIRFDDGIEVRYDVKDDIDTIPDFKVLKEGNLFQNVQLDTSRTCVYWNDRIDLPSDTLLEYGVR